MKTAVLAALLLLVPTAAFAGGKKTESEVRAEKWFNAGLAQSRAGDHTAALASFAAAYADVPSVDILWNLASTERRLGRTVPALTHLRAYLAHPSARADRKPMAEQWIEELSADVGQLVVASSPSAEISVDGSPRPSGAIDLVAGVHAVTVRCDDHAKSIAVDIAAGQRKEVSVPCEAPAPAPPPVVKVATSTPRTEAMQTITVTKPTSSARTWTVLGLSVGAVAAVTGGVIFAADAAQAQGKADGAKVALGANGFSCKSSGSVCADYDDARARATRSSGISTGLFVVGGVAGGAAVATFLLWPKETETKVVPAIGKDVASVTVTGRF